VVGLERGPLSLVRIIEELLESIVVAPVQKTETKGRGNSLRWPRDNLYLLTLALTSPTSGGRSVGIVRWRLKAPEFVCFLFVPFKAPLLDPYTLTFIGLLTQKTVPIYAVSRSKKQSHKYICLKGVCSY
jgi:hypothetical protein